LAVPARFGEPLPMLVRATIKVGLSLLSFAFAMRRIDRCDVVAVESRITFQP
jgi:hypothetical protein